MKKSIHASNKFVTKCIKIDETEAKNEDMLVYMSKIFMSATLPHSKPVDQIFRRTNGNHSLTLIANPQFGLPYGSLPRLILAWITKQVIRHKSPEINLGKTFSEFMKKLNFSHRSGGSKGDATRLRDQMLRLFTTQISVITLDKNAGKAIGNQYLFTSSFDLWWNPIALTKRTFKNNSTITLSSEFWKKLLSKPIPIDLRALIALRKSPMQIDIYIWLTYKFSLIKEPSKPISWLALQKQFGVGYPISAQGTRDFKKNFLNALHPVLVLYSHANVEVINLGLILNPSQTHIKKR